MNYEQRLSRRSFNEGGNYELFYAKQTQFSKHLNEHKSFYINELRTTNYELSWEKQTQTKPI